MDKDDAIALLLDLLGESCHYINATANEDGPNQVAAKDLLARISEAMQVIDCS